MRVTPSARDAATLQEPFKSTKQASRQYLKMTNMSIVTSIFICSDSILMPKVAAREWFPPRRTCHDASGVHPSTCCRIVSQQPSALRHLLGICPSQHRRPDTITCPIPEGPARKILQVPIPYPQSSPTSFIHSQANNSDQILATTC